MESKVFFRFLPWPLGSLGAKLIRADFHQRLWTQVAIPVLLGPDHFHITDSMILHCISGPVSETNGHLPVLTPSIGFC